MTRTYTTLVSLATYRERFEYLKLDGSIGEETFGWQRYLNQRFYTSREWQDFRRDIIIRDMGCDLGIDGVPIVGKVIIHHLNPISVDDIIDGNMESLMNPENCICVSLDTHNAIHYGGSGYLDDKLPIERRPNDTCPWRC